MKFILASQSPYRRAQLAALNLDFEAKAPEFDEKTLQDQEMSAAELSLLLAQKKAQSLCHLFPDQVIVGSDQVLSFQEKNLGKPGSRQMNEVRLQQMQGQSHELFTSVFLIGPDGQSFTHTDQTSMKMRPLSPAEIRAYIDRDRPWDCAGGYKFEQLGICLFEEIHTKDPSSIVGLPLLATLKGLRLWGIHPLR